MRISWENPGSHLFETGVDRGVFFPKNASGVPWNGLTSVNQTVENNGSVVMYSDGQKIVNQIELGVFSADISALTYPNEIYSYDGSKAPLYCGQPRPQFNLSYRSLIGNDTQNTPYGYRLHLVFNCTLTPTKRLYQTINERLDILDFTWKLNTVPIATPYSRPTSHFMIDAPNVEPGALIAIENILYGVDGGSSPTFPTIKQILDIFDANAIFIVVDNGNGTVTITGPDDWVFPVSTNQVQISSPSFNQIDTTQIFARSY